MTFDEAIKNALDVAKNSSGNKVKIHKELAAWLIVLRKLRKCKNNNE